MIDEMDSKILTILQQNARTPNAEIARQLDVAPSCIHERIRKLEKKGVITGYRATVNRAMLGQPVTAFSFIRTDEKPGEVATSQRLAEIEEVEEVYHIAGEDCYLVKLRCASNEDLGRMIREKIGGFKSVTSSRTSVVMETIKEDGLLPVSQMTAVKG